MLFFDHRLSQFVFGREVKIDRALGHLRRGHDVIHARAAVPRDFEPISSTLKNLSATDFGTFLHCSLVLRLLTREPVLGP